VVSNLRYSHCGEGFDALFRRLFAVTDLLHDKTAETFKGSIHMALFGLAAVCAAYNAGAAAVRPSRRLTVQAVGYALLAAFEARQTRNHWSGN
jgi:hypothetical protein